MHASLGSIRTVGPTILRPSEWPSLNEQKSLNMSGGVILMHQNRLMRRFRDAMATDPKSATTLADIGCRNSWIFRRMVARGVFIDTGEGQYYMDEDAARWFVKRRSRGRANGREHPLASSAIPDLRQ
jgi:hypothetical protein